MRFLRETDHSGDMRVHRAIILSTWFYSLLFWLYVVVRIIVNRIDPNDLFSLSVPYITFFVVGALTFTLSFICLVVYLAKWGFRNGYEHVRQINSS